MAQRTIAGACHCGKVRIEVDLDPGTSSGRCNCSICSKLRAWRFILKPQQFRLLTGEQDLGSYEWGAKIAAHRFCKHCGVHMVSCGYLKEVGGDFCSVNVAALDLQPAELAAIPVRYCDGLNNNWAAPPEYIAYL